MAHIPGKFITGIPSSKLPIGITGYSAPETEYVRDIYTMLLTKFLEVRGCGRNCTPMCLTYIAFKLPICTDVYCLSFAFPFHLNRSSRTESNFEGGKHSCSHEHNATRGDVSVLFAIDIHTVTSELFI